MSLPDKANLQYTNISNTSENTIVTADPGNKNALASLVITTVNAAIATLTLKDATAGTTRMVFNYPNAAAAPGSPLAITFDPPLPPDAKNANWTLTASVNASGFNVLATFVKA